MSETVDIKKVKVSAETLRKIKIVVSLFLENPRYTDSEIASITGFSKSSVQRYLTHPIIFEFCEEKEQQLIFEARVINQLEGKRKGGMTYFANNVPLKDSKGRFVGSIRYTGTQSRIEQKYVQIKQMVRIFLSDSNYTLDDIADLFLVTRDYVYDCFNVSYLSTLITKEDIVLLNKRLQDNKKLGCINGSMIVNSKTK